MNVSDRLQARSLLLDEVYLAKSEAEHQVKLLSEENEQLKQRVSELEEQDKKSDDRRES